MPQHQKNKKASRTKTSRHRRRHTKKATRRKTAMRGGFAGCDQAATIMEPGLNIKSFITQSKGLSIPSSRAMLSGSMPSCDKGSHPQTA